MTNSGQSKRSRAYQRQLDDEYQRVWGHRLPQDEKPQPYKKFGLPLVLAPFALMFCGGCVGSVPAASVLIALFFSVMWLGERVVESVKTESHWVVFRKMSLWKVGETKEAAAIRRAGAPTPLTDAERYPEDYAGRIQSLVPGQDPKPSWATDLSDCQLFSLTTSQRKDCWQRKLKVIGGKLVPVSFEDKFGANTAKLREHYSDDEVLGAKHGDDKKSIELQAKTLALSKALPRTVTHTGTGLYNVKKSPVNESEVQSGAVAGQVVTIVGTIAASPAFLGGYVTNTTRSQTRSIVSHTTNTVTLEGDITSWLDTDTLEFYDSWGTIDAAGEQLLVDQGVTRYTTVQEIRIYAGTYTEAVNIGTMEATIRFRLKFAINGSDSVTMSNTGLGAALVELNDSLNIEVRDIILNCDNNYMIDAGNRGPWFLYNCTCQGGNGGLVRDITCYDSTFTSQNYAFRCAMFHYERCTFTSCTNGASWAASIIRGNFYSCVFSGCAACISTVQAQYESSSDEYQIYITNSTFYNCTKVINDAAVTGINAFRLHVQNSIFHTCTTVWYGNGADTNLYVQRCDYNTYYNCTQVARLNGANVSFSSWQALTDRNGTSPDSHSLTSDPGITTPGSNWALTAESDCLHAGIGSYAYVATGHNGVDFDKWHPDKGAWSSGPGQNVAYIG